MVARWILEFCSISVCAILFWAWMYCGPLLCVWNCLRLGTYSVILLQLNMIVTFVLIILVFSSSTKIPYSFSTSKSVQIVLKHKRTHNYFAFPFMSLIQKRSGDGRSAWLHESWTVTRNLSQSQAELKLKEVSMIKKHDTIFVVILFLKPMLRSLPVFEKIKNKNFSLTSIK